MLNKNVAAGVFLPGGLCTREALLNENSGIRCDFCGGPAEFERAVDNNPVVIVGALEVIGDAAVQDDFATFVAPRCGMHEVRSICLAHGDADGSRWGWGGVVGVNSG